VSAVNGVSGSMSGYLQTLAALNPSSVTNGEVPKTPEEGLRKVTQEFESVFIAELMKQMRKTDFSGGLFGEDRAMKIFGEMRDESFAAEMAKAGGMGIGNMLYQELKKGL